MCLALSAQRGFPSPLYSPRPVSLCQHERPGHCSVGMMTSCLMTCHWQLRTHRSCRDRLPLRPLPLPLPLLAVIWAQRHQSHDAAELFRILLKMVEELELEWSLPEEPTHSRLDKCFLCSAAKEKGCKKLSSLDKLVAAHLCLPTAISWKAKVAHPSKPSKPAATTAQPAKPEPRQHFRSARCYPFQKSARDPGPS